MEKEYLGGNVHVTPQGRQMMLTVEDGPEVLEKTYVSSSVVKALFMFSSDLDAERRLKSLVDAQPKAPEGKAVPDCPQKDQV